MVRNTSVAEDDTGSWSVYMIKTDRGSLYTGIAKDVARRFADHVYGRGARSLRGARALELVWQVALDGRSEALRVESRIKSLRTVEKHSLCAKIRSRAELLDALSLPAK